MSKKTVIYKSFFVLSCLVFLFFSFGEVGTNAQTPSTCYLNAVGVCVGAVTCDPPLISNSGCSNTSIPNCSDRSMACVTPTTACYYNYSFSTCIPYACSAELENSIQCSNYNGNSAGCLNAGAFNCIVRPTPTGPVDCTGNCYLGGMGGTDCISAITCDLPNIANYGCSCEYGVDASGQCLPTPANNPVPLRCCDRTRSCIAPSASCRWDPTYGCLPANSCPGNLQPAVVCPGRNRDSCQAQTGPFNCIATRALPTLPFLCPTSTSINTAIGCLPVGDKNEFLAFILRWAIGISGGVSFLFIVYSGFIIMTATGDKRKVQAGRELLTAAVSGILLLIFSVFILDFIGIRILRIPGL